MAPRPTDTVDVPLLTLLVPLLLLLPLLLAPLVTQTEGVGINDGDTLAVGCLLSRVQFSHHSFTIQIIINRNNYFNHFLKRRTCFSNLLAGLRFLLVSFPDHVVAIVRYDGSLGFPPLVVRVVDVEECGASRELGVV